MKIKDLEVRDSSRVVSSDKALCTTFSLFIQVYKGVPATQLPGGEFHMKGAGYSSEFYLDLAQPIFDP